MSRASFMRHALRSLGLALPSFLIYAVGIVWSMRLGATSLSVAGLGQVVDLVELRRAPVDSLLNLHVQPPGYNVLVALATRREEWGEQPLFILNVGITLLVLFLIVLTVLRFQGSVLGAVIASSCFAFLPSTILYTFWPYNTQLISLLTLALLYGVVSICVSPRFGVAIATVALLGLFLVRPSYHWLPVAAGLLGLLWLAWRWAPSSRKVSLIGVTSGLLIVLLVQSHYYLSFGLLSTSSWSGANVFKALTSAGYLQRGPAPQVEALSPTCVQELVEKGPFLGDPKLYLECDLTPTEPVGSAALDAAQKANGVGENFNSMENLVFSRKVQELAVQMLVQDPTGLLSVPLASLPVFFSDPTDYAYVEANRIFLPAPWRISRSIADFLPAFMWGVLACGTVVVLRTGRKTSRLREAYLVGVCVVAYHTCVALFGEVGENFRFHVEIYPLILVLCVVGLGVLWRSGNQPELERVAVNRS